MAKPRNPDKWESRTCPQCGVGFDCMKTRPTRFCSDACYRESIAGLRATKECPQCGEPFSYHLSWPRKYCSDVCKGKALVGNIKHFEPSAYSAVCESCGETFTATAKRTRGRFCSQRCFGDWMQEHGPSWTNHPNWKGGGEYYYGPNWYLQRRLVLERDGSCVDCGFVPASAREALHVHHIIPFDDFGVERFREANDLSNLVALCNSCHQLRHKRASSRAS